MHSGVELFDAKLRQSGFNEEYVLVMVIIKKIELIFLLIVLCIFFFLLLDDCSFFKVFNNSYSIVLFYSFYVFCQTVKNFLCLEFVGFLTFFV
jgi:hypothetical protein